MPVNPTIYGSGPLTASQLNGDLYTYAQGNNHTPNGILFHANPPLVMSNLWKAPPNQGASAGGTSTTTEDIGFWNAAIDTSCLFGTGGDFMGKGAAGHFTARVPGSAGLQAASAGGWYLAWNVTAIGTPANAQGFGCQLYSNGATAALGNVQLSSTTRDNAAYGVDLMTATSVQSIAGGGFLIDSGGASVAYKLNATDYTGETCHFGALWAAPLASSGNTVLGSLPVPTTGYASNTKLTAALLNGNGIGGPLSFLNNPPACRAAGAPTTSIPNNGTLTPTAVPLTTAPLLDNWSGFSTGTSLYTVPVSGVYLVNGVVNYTASTAGQRVAGLKIAGGTTYWGPSYNATGAGVCRPSVLRLMDLNAGDTISLVTGQNSGGALALASSFTSRLVVKFMCALAASNSSLSWTAPDTKFRWQAGAPGSSLPGLFNSHLANDLSFLIQRPYLLAWQSTIQSGLSNAAFSVINMNTLGGRVHATAGDPYGGWTSGAANAYAAVVPGWYLCVLNVTQAVPSVTPAHPLAAIGYFQQGGAAQGSGTQQWGQHIRTTSASFLPGAEAIGLFYLRAGDFVQPQYQQQDGGATYNTAVGTTGQESSFGCVWVSE